jgi:hypothetical protein
VRGSHDALSLLVVSYLMAPMVQMAYRHSSRIRPVMFLFSCKRCARPADRCRPCATRRAASSPFWRSPFGPQSPVVSCTSAPQPKTREGLLADLDLRLIDHRCGVAGEGSDLDHGHVGTVAAVMSPFILSIGPESPVSDAIRLMAADHVHRILVIDDGNLVGIVSTMDVMRALTVRQESRS